MQSCLLQISPLHTHIHYDLHLPLTSYKQCINSNHFSPSNNKWLLIIMLQKHSFTEGMEKSAVSSWFILCCYCHYHVISLLTKKKVHEIESDLILLSLPSLSSFCQNCQLCFSKKKFVSKVWQFPHILST